MSYLYFKAVHLIFIVTWFAGLFYIVRLFVYATEASEKNEPEKSILLSQFLLMQRRLWYGITWPSAVLTAILGTTLVIKIGFIPDWLWVKLGLVFGLYAYHFLCHKLFLDHQKGVFKFSSTQLRIWNEVSTLFLVSIVFIVILKNALSMVYGIIGLLVFSTILMMAIFIYRKIRTQ